MSWYAAHVVIVFKFKEGRQTRFPAWENIVLIQADNSEEAFAIVFAGVRKLTLCEDEHKRPGDGTEITYLELELRSEKALEKFLAGEPASVTVADQFPEQDISETKQRPAGRRTG
jgi:Domain of unknown function (DUF4288)